MCIRDRDNEANIPLLITAHRNVAKTPHRVPPAHKLLPSVGFMMFYVFQSPTEFYYDEVFCVNEVKARETREHIKQIVLLRIVRNT